MKKRVMITTIVAFVLLMAAIAAGLNAIFTVTHVRAEFVTHSEMGKEEAVELREKLDSFIGKSTTFLDLGEVRSVVEEYPCFRVDLIEKQYPTTIHLEISERRETFAFLRESGMYAIFDEEGKYLYERAENVNRTAGENILLSDFAFTEEEGTLAGAYAQEILAAMATFRDTLTEIRANVVSVTLVQSTSNTRNDFFRIRMREGVVIDLGNPAVMPSEKAGEALGYYMSCSDEERIFGFITVLDGAEGKIYIDYSRNSRLG